MFITQSFWWQNSLLYCTQNTMTDILEQFSVNMQWSANNPTKKNVKTFVKPPFWNSLVVEWLQCALCTVTAMAMDWLERKLCVCKLQSWTAFQFVGSSLMQDTFSQLVGTLSQFVMSTTWIYCTRVSLYSKLRFCMMYGIALSQSCWVCKSCKRAMTCIALLGFVKIGSLATKISCVTNNVWDEQTGAEL